jgi:hypothetical protein
MDMEGKPGGAWACLESSVSASLGIETSAFRMQLENESGVDLSPVGNRCVRSCA